MFADDLLLDPRPVFTPDPIEWSHPLNHGRVGWWLSLPPNDSVLWFPDLCNKAPAINQNASGVSWQSIYRPGGFGRSLLFSTSSVQNYVDCGNPSQFQMTDVMTIGCTARWTGSLANSIMIAKWGGTSGWLIGASAANADKIIWAATIGGSVGAVTSTNTYNDGAWHRIIAVYDGANLKLYVDGIQTGGNTAASGTISNQSANNLVFGNYTSHSSTSNIFVGYLDDLFVSRAAWTQAMVTQDYELSRRGYPGVLRRMTPGRSTYLLTSPVTAVGNPYYYQALAGGGSF